MHSANRHIQLYILHTYLAKAMVLSDKFKIDRTKLSVDTLENQGKNEICYWKDKTPAERLEAVELLRQLQYSYDLDTAQLHRVFEVVERK